MWTALAANHVAPEFLPRLFFVLRRWMGARFACLQFSRRSVRWRNISSVKSVGCGRSTADSGIIVSSIRWPFFPAELSSGSLSPRTLPETAHPAVSGERLVLLDLLRALAAQLIVWHHLVFFGPLSDSAAEIAPAIFAFLDEYGRYAVQTFLVIGGFVAGRSLSQRKNFRLHDVGNSLGTRYWRIAGPYLCMLPIALLANGIAAAHMDHASISAFPTIPQLAAHVLLLHEILGYEPLSAGLWYLAIDFQLGLAVLLIFWLAHRLAEKFDFAPLVVAQFLIWPLAAMSLFCFNGDSRWEDWSIYFFGSYTCGLITAWTVQRALPAWSFWLFAGLMVAALVIDFRPRLAVSLVTGLIIFTALEAGLQFNTLTRRWLKFPAATSFSLFLIHFPVCLVVNAVLSNHVLHSPILSLAGMGAAYSLSLIAAFAFYYGVERRFHGPTAALEAVSVAR